MIKSNELAAVVLCGYWIKRLVTPVLLGTIVVIRICSLPIKVDSGERLYMGNAATATVEGKGNVIMEFTSGKEIILPNVLHVLKVRKNLMSRPMLNKKWFKLIFVSDKFVMNKRGMRVGKCYLSDKLFKIDYTPKIATNENIVNSSYIVELSNL